MRLHRFYIPSPLSDDGNKKIDIVDKEIVNQIKNVFRYLKGDEVLLFDGTGKETHAIITDISKDNVSFTIKDIYENKTEAVNNVILYCSILKKENFEWVAEKSTEVGVKEIVPITTARTVKFNLNFERIKKIAKEATEQSGRAIVPEIKEVIKFEDALKKLNKTDTNIIFDISGASPSTWTSHVQVFCHSREGGNPENGNKIHGSVPVKTGIRSGMTNIIKIFIGPEGGWEDFEIEKARETGFKVLSLGKTTLRGETAAIIASYLAVNLS